jgi:hypothetical protein
MIQSGKLKFHLIDIIQGLITHYRLISIRKFIIRKKRVLFNTIMILKKEIMNKIEGNGAIK